MFYPDLPDDIESLDEPLLVKITVPITSLQELCFSSIRKNFDLGYLKMCCRQQSLPFNLSDNLFTTLETRFKPLEFLTLQDIGVIAATDP